MNNRKLTGGALTRRNALTVALAVGLGFTGVAFGQATTGTIFGSAPAAAGQTVTVKGSGVSRTVTVGQNGRYSVSNLPVGTYTVTLNKGGQTVNTHQNVNITVGAGTEVDFAQATTQLKRGAGERECAAEHRRQHRDQQHRDHGKRPAEAAGRP